MVLSEIISYLEQLAPPIYQEPYDNAGLIAGNLSMNISKAIICLDCIETVVDEAIEHGANLIIAHHPIIFSGLKKINGNNYVERVLIKAIKHDIAIYAIHTNLDNVADGVNYKIAEKLGLQHLGILQPKADVLKKLVTFAPIEMADKVRNALFEAGAGDINNYRNCSFNVSGEGTFKGNQQSNPTIGKKNVLQIEPETRIEVVFHHHLQSAIVNSLLIAHPYEEVVYDIYNLNNTNNLIGAGIIGNLPSEMLEKDFLQFIKQQLHTNCIKHTALRNQTIKKIAICGGAGSFLLKAAIKASADVFITADFKYHEFFDAENKLIIADVGHYESEQFTIDLIYDYLLKKNPTFALLKTKVNTNPVNYFY